MVNVLALIGDNAPGEPSVLMCGTVECSGKPTRHINPRTMVVDGGKVVMFGGHVVGTRGQAVTVATWIDGTKTEIEVHDRGELATWAECDDHKRVPCFSCFNRRGVLVLDSVDKHDDGR